MNNVTKGISIALIIILLVCMTVAYIFALPSSAMVTANAAEQEIVYHNYEYILHTLPFPMGGIETIDDYEYTLTGPSEEGRQYKIFEIELYEKYTDGKRSSLKKLGTIPLKVTVMYDVGYCFYPRTTDNVSVNWRDDTDWATYLSTDNMLYGTMSTNINSEEAIYKDREFWFEFQTLHALNDLVIAVFDPMTNYRIYTNRVDTSHVEIELCNYETLTTRENAIPLYITQEDTALTFDEGYDMGFIDGEIQGQKNAASTSDGYQLGYDTGYQIGHKEGYKEGTYDVNLELTEVTGNTVGSITDTIMKFLKFEVAGISVWSILAIVGGILVIGVIIKLVY